MPPESLGEGINLAARPSGSGVLPHLIFMNIAAQLKAQVKKSKLAVKYRGKLAWRLHFLKDWWGTRVWKKTTEVVTPLGFKLTAGIHPAYDLMSAGTFQPGECALISKLVGKEDLFVDIGANLGYYTCLTLQKGRPVAAVEPQPPNLQCLFQNLRANVPVKYSAVKC